MENRCLEAEFLLNEGNTHEALIMLESILDKEPMNKTALFLRAKVYYKLQQWGNALNDLNNIIDNYEDNDAAINYKKMIVDIIKFWNKDSYNP
jgi:uncharacterized protein HemY